MKRVFVVGYSENKGGVENYIDILTRNISCDKFDIVLSMPTMIIDGVKWTRPKNRHNYIKYYCFWRRFFKSNIFDAVYFNTCDIVGIDVLKFAKKAGVPIRIIHSHNSENSRKLNCVHKFLEKYNKKNLDKYATHFLACSKNSGEWMFGKHRVYKIINNAIETAKFEYNTANRLKIRKELHIDNEYVIGMVGRLEIEKNHLYALRVFEKIQEQKKQSYLIIVGDGTLRTEIENKINNSGISGSIKMLGRREDVYKIMSAFDCFLMPSTFEGFPFVLVEAQAAGLPCVVSDTISKEVDISGNVHFVSLDSSPDEWAQQIIEYATSEKRIENAQVLREKGYDIKDNIKYIESILLNEEIS